MSFAPRPLAYAFLVPAAGLAGFVDAIAGGGGIITIPALLAAGVPPHLALGTNKLQASVGTLIATANYRRAGLFTFRELLPGILAAASGAVLGAAVVSAVSASFLTYFIPALLAAILAFLVVKPSFGLEPSRARLPRLTFWIGAGLVMGFYDGFFGPGTGTFWSMAMVGLAGFGLKEATGRTKVVNLASNLFSLGLFLAEGSVLFALGAAMAAAQVIGAALGSRMVLARGAAFVRVVLIVVTAGMIVYIVFRYWAR